MDLVGAVGIENTTDGNLKDLERIIGNAKTLKRNDRECKGILIGPLMAPRFSLARSSRKAGCGSNSRRGWQTGFTSMKLNPTVLNSAMLSRDETIR